MAAIFRYSRDRDVGHRSGKSSAARPGRGRLPSEHADPPASWDQVDETRGSVAHHASPVPNTVALFPCRHEIGDASGRSKSPK
jgi:hypothetical protein